jgi:hypothetical protein
MDALDRMMEDLDRFESFEKGMNFVTKKYGAQNANMLRGAMEGGFKSNPVSFRGDKNTPGAAAILDFKVTRNQIATGETVPVVLFGGAMLMDRYTGALGAANAVPSAITAKTVILNPLQNDTVAPNSDGRFGFFGYTKGANTDYSTVECQQVPYAQFLAGTMTDAFRLTRLRFTLTDTSAAGLAQLNQTLQYVQISSFGTRKSINVPLGSMKSPQNFQSGIVDIPVTLEFDKESCLIIPVIPVLTTFTVTAFIEKIAKLNAQTEL